MLFSVNYHSTRLKEADEIRCPINQLGQIYNFLKENSNKRYVITEIDRVEWNKAIEQIDIIREKVRDYTIECTSIIGVKKFINNGYHAFIKYPVTDWETLQGFLTIGVSDVYIDGSLGFSLKEVAKLCADTKTKIRISPTVSSNAALTGIEPYSFFIRPEDLSLYEKYINVIDFKVQDKEKEDALFSIYKRGSFYYNLKDLLDSCTFSVLNPFIKPEFGQARINCGQRCLIPGHSCHLCETQIQLTNLVYDYFKEKNAKTKDKNVLQ